MESVIHLKQIQIIRKFPSFLGIEILLTLLGIISTTAQTIYNVKSYGATGNVSTNFLSSPTNNGAWIIKADNNNNLNLGSSWTNGVAPGTTNIAIWDATVATAANCTNMLNANANWGGIQILNPIASVAISTNSSGALFLGASGIDLSAAAVDLSIGVALTTVQPQMWTIANGRSLNFIATNKAVVISSNPTIHGAVNYSGNFNVCSNSILTISGDAVLSATNPGIVNSFSILQVGTDVKGGTVNQVGGRVVFNTIGGTSGNPKVSMHVATAANAMAVYNLSGGTLTDTTANNASDTIIGDASGATGIFNLSCNASAQFVSLRIGNNGGTGIVNVTNGNLTVSGGEFSIGRGSGSGSAGTMNVFGGTVSANVNLQLAHGIGPGILNLNGGIISVPAITAALSSGVLNWNGGILKATASTASFISNSIIVNVNTNGAIFDTTNFNVTLSVNMRNGAGGNADGGLTKLGAGTLTLSGVNTFNGPTIVSVGTLIVSNVNSIANSTNIVVNSGATLNVSGIGALLLNSAPVLNGALIMQIRKNGSALANDQLSIGDSALNFGGALTVTAAGDALAAGDEFDLFDASQFAGAFSVIHLPPLPAGLVWDTSSLKMDGAIKVVNQIISVSFSSISRGDGGFNLDGAGGIASNAFYVATSTNLALPLANWTILSTNYFDANGSFQITNIMNPIITSQFFALLLSLPSSQTNSQTLADTEIVSMLQNIRDNGWDGVTSVDGGLGTNINNGLGGLWVNWRYGTEPLLVNFNGSGSPDGASVNPPRHDELTDMRYLHNLWWYKKFHPADTQFDADLLRYTAIVKYEFTTNVTNKRGWMYDEELIPLWQLSGDDFYRQAAFNEATYFADKLYRTNIGAYYDTNSTATNGYYRVDWQLEIGCALIHAGTIFTNSSWVTKGSNMVEFTYKHAYLTNYHHFLQDMSNVISTNGTAVSNEDIYVSGGTDGGAVRMSPLGQEALSLLHVYLVTSNQLYLNRAMDLLTPETIETNSFGLWDTNYGGYYGGLEFSGKTFQNPGTPALISKKEGGRQMDMLEAFHLANTLTTNRYAPTEAALKNVLLNKTYYAPGHGVLYEVNADWSVRTINGQPENWVTTEAMGIVLEALFSLQDPQPW